MNHKINRHLKLYQQRAEKLKSKYEVVYLRDLLTDIMPDSPYMYAHCAYSCNHPIYFTRLATCSDFMHECIYSKTLPHEQARLRLFWTPRELL